MLLRDCKNSLLASHDFHDLLDSQRACIFGTLASSCSSVDSLQAIVTYAAVLHVAVVPGVIVRARFVGPFIVHWTCSRQTAAQRLHISNTIHNNILYAQCLGHI